MCQFFKVSRSGYYDFVRRKDEPDRDENLARIIAECQESCGRIYGCRRVKFWLQRSKNVCLNYKTVWRVVHKCDLLAEIRRRKYRKTGETLHRYPNLLNRQFKAECPNQKRVTDISYIQTGQGVLFLSVIRDLFDNSIMA
jgi:putative transposase